MVDSAVIGKLLQSLTMAVNTHDRENPGHHTWGIGMSAFDIDRLGLEDGEEILPGIVLQADGGCTGQFRILCDGQHQGGLQEEEEETLDAVATEEVAEPVYAPGPGTPPPPVTPPF